MKAALTFCFSFFCLIGVKQFMADRLRKLLLRLPWKVPFGDLVFESVLQINNLFLAALSIVWALSVLDWSPRFERALSASHIGVIFLILGIWIVKILNLLGSHFAGKTKSGNGGNLTSIAAASFLLKLLLWITLGVLFLENVGVNISSLIAGLGIGGIAIALAVQSILSDLLASISLIADKPFVIGDVISVGSDIGTVEEIGIKTTKLRSLTGEALIYPNSDLLKNRIKNFQRMKEKRISFLITLDPDSSFDKVRTFPSIIEACFEGVNELRYVGCYLMRFTGAGPEFELVYLICKEGLNQQMALQNLVSVKILESVEAAKIALATSTQKITIAREQNS